MELTNTSAGRDLIIDQRTIVYRSGIARLRPDLKRRLAGIFNEHERFAGRDRELAQLDSFAGSPTAGYLVVTGSAGMGKTALLAAWIKRLEATDTTRVVYHFLNRQRGTATQQDTLASLVSQAYAAWPVSGEPDDHAATVADLESLWLSLLDVRPYPADVVVVIDGLDEAQGWRLSRVLFPPDLPDGVHVVLSARTMAGRHWPTELGLIGAAELKLGGLDAAGVAAVAQRGGAPRWALDPEALAMLAARARGDPFYLRLLVDELRAGTIRSAAELERRPALLDDYLRLWWDELTEPAANRPAVGDLLGYLLVALGPITRDELIDIDPADALKGRTFDAALAEIGRFVVGEPRGLGLSLTHWRLQDYLSREVFSAQDQRDLQAALIAWCDGWPKHHARYALVNGAAHRIWQAVGPADLVAVATLLRTEDYQLARIENADDAVGLVDDLDRIVAAMSRDADVPVEALITAAVAVGEVRHRWLRPESVFELAWRGRIPEAVRRLRLLPGQALWRSAAMLVLVWIGSSTGPAAARELLAGLDPSALQAPLLGLLRRRVAAALGDGPEPNLTMPPPPLPLVSLRSQAQAALLRLGGTDDPEMVVRGLRPVADFTEDNEGGGYLAESDAPPLVAYARDVPGEGDGWLADYIDLHHANPYAQYRDRSLWTVLGAVCRLPDPEQARRHAVQLAEGAFAPSPVQFAEFAPLAAKAHLARRGEPDATAWVAAARSEALTSAGMLTAAWRGSDQWGHHCRRLAAHAEVAAIILGDQAVARELLAHAARIPAGFAGYQAPASLIRAESHLVADAPADLAARAAALHAALHAAHNVQDPAFCALTTARVNTVMHWWSTAVGDVPAMVAEFLADPGAARFSPTHRLHEDFPLRSRPDHLPIEHITAADSLGDLAHQVFQVPLVSLARLNPIPGIELIAVPDADFAPIAAGWLSAQVLAAALPRPVKVKLLATLVPIVSGDETMLDLVLGRMLGVLEDPEPTSLQRALDALTVRTTTEPTGGIEAGIA